jgi:hypothetical protein
MLVQARHGLLVPPEYATPESVVDLHPKEYLSSEALGVGGSQQVGYVWGAVAAPRQALPGS